MKNLRDHAVMIGAALAAMTSACTTPSAPQAWTVPEPGKTWKIAERNTGSFGKDAEYQVTRGNTTWNGTPAVLYTRSTGFKVVTTPDQGRWLAMLGPDDKPVLTWDPPIGFDMPLQSGAKFTRYHSMAGRSGTVTYPFACTVGTMEKVTVRAGTFDAYRVDCTTAGSEETYWTAPAIGVHVKTDLRRLPVSGFGEGRQQAELIEAPR